MSCGLRKEDIDLRQNTTAPIYSHHGQFCAGSFTYVNLALGLEFRGEIFPSACNGYLLVGVMLSLPENCGVAVK